MHVINGVNASGWLISVIPHLLRCAMFVSIAPFMPIHYETCVHSAVNADVEGKCRGPPPSIACGLRHGHRRWYVPSLEQAAEGAPRICHHFSYTGSQASKSQGVSTLSPRSLERVRFAQLPKEITCPPSYILQNYWPYSRESHLPQNSNTPQLPVNMQLAINLARAGHYGNGSSLMDVALWAGVSVGLVRKASIRVMIALVALHD